MPLLPALLLAFAAPPVAAGGDPGIAIGMHGIVQHGIYHHALSSRGQSISDRTRGSAIADLAFDYSLSSRNRVGTLLRWAAGSALNNTGGLTLPPYGGDVEDNVRDINGHERDYLLEAWLEHRLEPARGASLTFRGGIIDASNYVDRNAFANDEFSQFMNSAFVLNHLAGIPAYDPGATIEFQSGHWTATAVAMRSRDEGARSYTYYGAEVGRTTRTVAGEGNYRLFVFSTSSDFEDPDRGGHRPLRGASVSVDQYLVSWLGVFARIGYQSHVAPDYERLYSAGVHLEGLLWNRPGDAAGIAVARLDGEDHSTLAHTDVLEFYTRFALHRRVDLSFDVQYMKDRQQDTQTNPHVVVLGTRLNLSF